MKYGAGLLFAILALWGGERIYREFIRPVDPLTSDTLALALHFQKSGIPVRPYAVRHNFRHTEMSAAAAFEIKGFPLPVSIDVCPNAAGAANHLLGMSFSHHLSAPRLNARLLMTVPTCAPGTDA